MCTIAVSCDRRDEMTTAADVRCPAAFRAAFPSVAKHFHLIIKIHDVYVLFVITLNTHMKK